MIRLAMIRVGSGERKEPIATKLGTNERQQVISPLRTRCNPDDGGRERGGLTFSCTLILEKQTSSLAEANWTKGRCDDSCTRTQELFRLVYVIDALSATSDMLRVDWTDGVPSRTNAKYQWILSSVSLCVLACGHQEPRHTLALTGSVYSVLR